MSSNLARSAPVVHYTYSLDPRPYKFSIGPGVEATLYPVWDFSKSNFLSGQLAFAFKELAIAVDAHMHAC